MIPKTEEPTLADYTIRAASFDDLAAYRDLLEVYMIETYGASNLTMDDVHSEWSSPEFDPAKSVRLAVTPEGQLVGMVEVWDTGSMPVRPNMWAFVHPEHRNRGIGTALSQWGIARARQVFDRVPEDARVVLQSWASRANEGAQQLLRDVGMTLHRSGYTMLIEMTEPPAPAEFPQDIRLVTYKDLNDLLPFVIAHKESFRDHRGFVDTPIEKRMKFWQHYMESNPRSDPELWIVALHGDEGEYGGDLAGVLVGNPNDETYADMGWIEIVGVLRSYRRQGLGLALLRHAFGLYYQRGIYKVGLGVDGASLTNATALYERAGMHIHHINDVYELELRPGVEISKQE
jgi:mycothiol synthase